MGAEARRHSLDLAHHLRGRRELSRIANHRSNRTQQTAEGSVRVVEDVPRVAGIAPSCQRTLELEERCVQVAFELEAGGVPDRGIRFHALVEGALEFSACLTPRAKRVARCQPRARVDGIEHCPHVVRQLHHFGVILAADVDRLFDPPCGQERVCHPQACGAGDLDVKSGLGGRQRPLADRNHHFEVAHLRRALRELDREPADSGRPHLLVARALERCPKVPRGSHHIGRSHGVAAQLFEFGSDVCRDVPAGRGQHPQRLVRLADHFDGGLYQDCRNWRDDLRGQLMLQARRFLDPPVGGEPGLIARDGAAQPRRFDSGAGAFVVR
jgi:hypothetical protein